MKDTKTAKKEERNTSNVEPSSASHPLAPTDQAHPQTGNAGDSATTPAYNQPRRERGAPNWLMVIFTGLIFAVTAAYSFFSWGQWSSMEKSIDEIRQNRELEYRAYVGVKSVKHETRPGLPIADVNVTISNTGRTPARNAVIQGTLALRETPLPADAPLTPPDVEPSKNVIAPQIDMTLTVGVLPVQVPRPSPTEPVSVPNQRPKQIQQPSPVPEEAKVPIKGAWYAYGFVEYDDIFGRHHSTRFCYYNLPGTKDWVGCAVGNTFD